MIALYIAVGLMFAYCIYKDLQADAEIARLYDSNEHAHTCTALGAYDCPHCGLCRECGGVKSKPLS